MKLFGIRTKESRITEETAVSEESYFVSEKEEKEEAAKEIRPEPEKAETFLCSGCNSELPLSEAKKNLLVCPYCGKHAKVSAIRRMKNLADPGTFRRLKLDLKDANPLDYPGYEEKIEGLRNKTGLSEAVLAGVCEVEGHRVVACVMGSEFMMGSMGIQVGEIITRSFEVADKMGLPIIIFTASGGARMQEGILSLMQMAKTSAAAKRFHDHGGLYISCLTHPTTGGVSASFATLADITIAEPGALIGFAGPRVIEQTIGEKLPLGFQRAEYLEEHGFVDAVIPRNELRGEIAHILRLHEKRRRAV